MLHNENYTDIIALLSGSSFAPGLGTKITSAGLTKKMHADLEELCISLTFPSSLISTYFSTQGHVGVGKSETFAVSCILCSCGFNKNLIASPALPLTS